MESFGPATRGWFQQTFAAPTPVQDRGWREIAAGRHSLLIAPTGSGKTLAAFLWAIDRFTVASAERDEKGVEVLYVSPLKALVHDVERNLRVPLSGIARAAEAGGHQVRIPSVAIRTGDTPSRDRQRQARNPADILVTTPESLYLLLTSQARSTLSTVRTVIIDEVHALAASKRGAHLALSLERLAALCERDPQRIGLSATARPLEEVARFVGGDRDVTIIDAGEAPRLDVRIVVPVPDMTRPTEGLTPVESTTERTAVPGTGEALDNSIWPAIYPRLLELIDSHRTTIVFVNSRGLCERLSQRLNEIAGRELVLAHHGSVARERREQIEGMLERGDLKAIVATSSLELGIDMQAVDLVVLVESPGGVARGLQRIGRAGHGVGEVSRGRIFPKHRGDLLESTVVAARMKHASIEGLALPRNPLDVLAQQIVAMCAASDWQVDALEALVRRCASFSELPHDALVGVLDMLSGRYPSHAFADLRPRIVWDRETDTLRGRRGTKEIAVLSGGTIPDRGTYAVVLGESGPRVGELDEEMVHESAPGQHVMLGASTWRIDAITRDRVIVSPAPGESGKLPFWRGDGPGRPVELGRAIGAFTGELARRSRGEAQRWLLEEHGLDAWAAENLVTYVHEQRELTGTLPTDRAITVERFRDELGDWRICILSPLGSRVNAPWALALQARIEEVLARAGGAGAEVQALWSDDGIVLRLVDVDELPSLDVLVPEPETVEEQVVEQLARSALFAGQFRENAARALLLPRRRANARTPLWAQRLKAQQLLAVAQEYPSFPIVIETYRSCLQDIFDLPALVELLRSIQRGDVRVEFVETRSASPFARSLVFAYVAAFLYEGDTPLAERKAQALALDRKLLRELLGHEELTEILDADVIDELEAQLQRMATDWQARHADDVADLLRRVGDLDVQEIVLRSRADPSSWIEELVTTRRVEWVLIGGGERYVDPDDVATYDEASRGSSEALEVLVHRWARTHGPFDLRIVAERFGVELRRVTAVAESLERAGKLERGGFRGRRPGERGDQWCDTDVLRRIKRRTLARLRSEIAPVPPAVLGRFLPEWHGIGARRIGTGRLEEALARLEGLPLPYDELEQVILPARVPGFAPRMLDELGAMGTIVWVGHGGLGRVALYRRDRVPLLLEPPVIPEDLGPLQGAILERLETRGASFFVELHTACGPNVELAAVEDALWDLAWQGLVTNDTFAPLRAARRPATRPRAPRRRGTRTTTIGGRWSLVSELLVTQTHPTKRAHARASLLLERHGIVTREVASLEPMPGGFSAVYGVLRAMEESGKVRRGWFVEALGGAQFASAGAVDRLRELREVDDRTVQVLSAIDPANPYGWLLPWPAREDESAPARRVAGAAVVLVGGEAALYLDRGGRRMLTFPAADDPEVSLAAARALTEVARRRRGKVLRIETIDGHSARTSKVAATLRQADFTSDPRGLVLEAR